MARTVAEYPALSGSMANAKAVPSEPTTTDQNPDPARFSVRGQPGRTRPSGPIATMLPPPDGPVALVRPDWRRYRTLSGPMAGAAKLVLLLGAAVGLAARR
jgi:hypothetical protein